MKRVLKALMMVALVGLAAGCGSSGGEFVADPNAPVIRPTQNTGTAAFEFILARAVPSEVDEIDFYGFAEDGTLVYGPAPRAKAPQIVLENLPLYIRSFRLDYYDGNDLVAQGQVPVILTPNGRVTINDPDFQTVTASSLVVVPESTQMTAGTSRTLNATVTLSNGDTFSVTSDATYSSNTEAVTVDSQGRLTAVSVGNAVITVSYRGLSETVTVEVVPSN